MQPRQVHNTAWDEASKAETQSSEQAHYLEPQILQLSRLVCKGPLEDPNHHRAGVLQFVLHSLQYVQVSIKTSA